MPKRWYQLSMLQVLVAMTVVAGSIALNLRTQKDRIVRVADQSGNEWKVMADVSGWPFVYRHETVLLHTVEYKWWAVVGNVASCAAILSLSLILASLLPSNTNE